ncbi:MAG: hypothetical protein FD149_1844 [Rhodospirillaceae bacterium]|nr:MAG: hypothetical protein FD149_1844 [Rhodospirillaceae bacterium]
MTAPAGLQSPDGRLFLLILTQAADGAVTVQLPSSVSVESLGGEAALTETVMTLAREKFGDDTEGKRTVRFTAASGG